MFLVCLLKNSVTNAQRIQCHVRERMEATLAYHRILKLTRTIADLAEKENIQTTHVAESIQYRPRQQT
jgi:magnesium chelatase family protein